MFDGNVLHPLDVGYIIDVTVLVDDLGGDSK
jgi:hypothetical protein